MLTKILLTALFLLVLSVAAACTASAAPSAPPNVASTPGPAAPSPVTAPPALPAPSTQPPVTPTVPSATIAPSEGNSLIVKGKEIYLGTPGGPSCRCHGLDAKGTNSAPGILGSSAEKIKKALQTVAKMGSIKLNNDQIEAVASYLKSLQ